MARYDDLAFDCLIDSIDAAYSSANTDSGCGVDNARLADVLRMLGVMLNSMQEPAAEFKLIELASGFEGNEDATKQLEELDAIVETLCFDILDIEDDKLEEWVEENKGKTIVVLPDGVDKEDIDDCINAALEEIERNKL